jgi:hypothetical protein
MLTGFWVTQIAGAVATYSIADHLAKGPATAEEISKMAGIESMSIRHWSNGAVHCYSSSGEKEVANLMKIGFVSLYSAGHVNPMSAVARHLQSRNHEVSE